MLRKPTARPPLALLALLAWPACAHSALIESDPPGAELYVNGTQVGVTPFTLEDTPGGGERYEIVLQKPGYEILQATLQQDQFSWPRGVASIACGACTLGLGCLGLLWAWQLQDHYSYVLKPAGSGPTSAASQPAEPGADAAPGAASQPAPVISY
jgi:hypothetical protein